MLGKLNKPSQLLHAKGKVLLYSLLSVGPRADPGVQAVRPQVTLSHPPDCHYFPSGLQLPSKPNSVTYQSVSTKLCCLVTETHGCEQLVQGCYLESDRPRFEPQTFWIASESSIITPYRPHVTSADSKSS